MTRVILILLLFTAHYPVLSQVRLDLERCREMALRCSKSLAMAGKQRDQAVWTSREYRANYFPRLSATGTYYYRREKLDYKLNGGYLPTYIPGADGHLQPNLVMGGDGHPMMGVDGKPLFQSYAFLPDIPLTFSVRGVYAVAVQLQQPIFMGGKIRAARQAARFSEALADENVRLNRSGILVELEQAYWQCIRARELVVVAESYKSVVNELVQNLENARQVGMASLNDVLKARVKYNEALLRLQQAEHGRTLTGMNLCRLVGLDLHAVVELTDTLSATITPGILELPDALEQRPDYRMLGNEVDIKQRETRVARADFLPQLGVTAGYDYGGGLTLNGDDSRTGSFSAMALVEIPIFAWGKGRNKVRVARAGEEISRLNRERLGEVMTLEMVESRFQLRDALTRVELTRVALEQATENLKVSRDQYAVGMEDLAGLLEAQAVWQQTWSDGVDARAALKLRETEYLKALGRLE